MYITVNRIGNSITGSVNGESFGVMFTPERFAAMQDLEQSAAIASDMVELTAIIEKFKALTKETYKELVEHKTPYLFVNAATGQYFLKVGSGDTQVISKEPLPQAFVDRIVQSVELGIDILPLVKAWARFLRNPYYTHEKAIYFANYINNTYTNKELQQKFMDEDGVSAEVALERATSYQTPITQEGLIQTYKVSAELGSKYKLEDGKAVAVPTKEAVIDEISGLITYKNPEFVEERIFYPAFEGLNGGDAFYCGDTLGHLIRVGQRHRLESWSQVNTTDGIAGVKGLHCGNLNYIRNYQHAGTETHNVFVDPAMIGAFTNLNDGAIRVLEYFVHSSFAGVNRGIYQSSTYAKMTDEAFQVYLREAIEAHAVQEAKFADSVTEMTALTTI